jgi:hypothetical protein
LSVRDFSLSERHNVDAAHGYARRFMPGAARLARGVETLTRRPLPALRPNRLWYEQPIYYLNNPMTFVPSGTPVAFPPYTRALDYELQLAFVIGEPLRDATPEQAERAIAAFAVMCDFSARDVQIPEVKSGMGPQKAKHFLSSLGRPSRLRRRPAAALARTGGDRDRQRPDTRPSAHRGLPLRTRRPARPRLAGEHLLPGEVFSIGALCAGSGMEISQWLAHGDELELDLPGVGRVSHIIK